MGKQGMLGTFDIARGPCSTLKYAKTAQPTASSVSYASDPTARTNLPLHVLSSSYGCKLAYIQNYENVANRIDSRDNLACPSGAVFGPL